MTPDTEVGMSTWDRAQQLRTDAAVWLPTAQVELDTNPTQNIGSLHAKIAETRTWANKVRDHLFQVMNTTIALRREAQATEGFYDDQMAKATISRADEDAVKKFKTKEEREMVLRQGVAAFYHAKQEAAARLEEWEQYQKAVHLVYYSLANTRDDIGTQVAVLKQQMFSGEVKPNPELGKISSLSDLLGDSARSLLSGAPAEDVLVPSGPSGETSW